MSKSPASRAGSALPDQTETQIQDTEITRLYAIYRPKLNFINDLNNDLSDEECTSLHDELNDLEDQITAIKSQTPTDLAVKTSIKIEFGEQIDCLLYKNDPTWIEVRGLIADLDRHLGIAS
ncbi:MAG: hypothetical protein ACWA40_03665 [Planktomarina sp.]